MKTETKRIRLFNNPVLESLTYTHPIVPLLFWTPIVSFLFYRAFGVHNVGGYEAISVSLGAFLFWTMLEYALHRFAFHHKSENVFINRVVYILHGVHHDSPQDGMRLVMPPAGGLLIGVIPFFGAKWLLGPALGELFFAVLVIFYLVYDYIHYSTHHFNPRTRVGQWIKHHHMQHHFAAPDRNWGVSSPLWDYCLGTIGRPLKRAK